MEQRNVTASRKGEAERSTEKQSEGSAQIDMIGEGMEPQRFEMICKGLARVEKQCGGHIITKWRNQNENNHN